jgi:hypothetical protein
MASHHLLLSPASFVFSGSLFFFVVVVLCFFSPFRGALSVLWGFAFFYGGLLEWVVLLRRLQVRRRCFCCVLVL